MKRIFLDTNILLDVFLERKPFCEPAQFIWTLAEKRKLKAAISAVSVVNVFFIIKKLAGKEKAYQACMALMDFFQIIETGPRLIQSALKSRFADLEDAIQYYSALHFKAQAIVSRDPSDFGQGELPIFDAPQFLSLGTVSNFKKI